MQKKTRTEADIIEQISANDNTANGLSQPEISDNLTLYPDAFPAA